MSATHDKSKGIMAITSLSFTSKNRALYAQKIKCKTICYFSYDVKGNAFNKGPNANVVVPLTNNLKSQKKRLIQEVYGFREGIFENNLCDMAQEAFYFQELA